MQNQIDIAKAREVAKQIDRVAENFHLKEVNADLLAACEAVVASPRSQHIAGGYYIQVSLAPAVIAQVDAAIAKAEKEVGK